MDEKLALIEAETARCGDIVRNLLLFSRQRDAAREPEDLAVVLERALKLIHHQAGLAQVSVEKRIDAPLPLVSCNTDEIQQAILALLINAIEAMPEGGTVRADIRSGGDDELEIAISDTGPGVPEELRSRIFEPFFSTKSEGKGTGLGLAVVYGIVQRHGGRITLESPPGGGARFRIRLPVHAPITTGTGPDRKPSVPHGSASSPSPSHEEIAT
jgi:two-component system NtrC family sensor kinase